MKKISIGLPKMHKESGEKRDFLPDFVNHLLKHDARVVLEQGYGSQLGLIPADYQNANPAVQFGSQKEVYQSDIVLILRAPTREELERMRFGSCLISMMHYHTRPQRVAMLRELGIQAISLDSIRDDSGRRMIENFNAVAWNGTQAAFQLLESIYPKPGFMHPDRPPIRATLIGAGALGGKTIRAAVRYGNEEKHRKMVESHIPGVIVRAVDADVTSQEKVMRDLLNTTDVLIDASSRMDSTQPIIPNEWIADLPKHAVILDLAVDPYQETPIGFYTKGVEGIPQGNLDQYVFAPHDAVFDELPEWITKTHRRHVVSCYSWPGIHPKRCMKIYGDQLRPLMRTLISLGGIEGIHSGGHFFERAIARAFLPSE